MKSKPNILNSENTFSCCLLHCLVIYFSQGIEHLWILFIAFERLQHDIPVPIFLAMRLIDIVAQWSDKGVRLIEPLLPLYLFTLLHNNACAVHDWECLLRYDFICQCWLCSGLWFPCLAWLKRHTNVSLLDKKLAAWKGFVFQTEWVNFITDCYLGKGRLHMHAMNAGIVHSLCLVNWVLLRKWLLHRWKYVPKHTHHLRDFPVDRMYSSMSNFASQKTQITSRFWDLHRSIQHGAKKPSVF